MIITDKVCVVTGAAKGIGFAICKRLLDAGAKVVLGDADGKSLSDAMVLLSSEHAASPMKSSFTH